MRSAFPVSEPYSTLCKHNIGDPSSNVLIVSGNNTNMTAPKGISFILLSYLVALFVSIASGHGSHFRQKRGLYSKGKCPEYDFFCKAFGTLDAHQQTKNTKTNYLNQFQNAVRNGEQNSNYDGKINWRNFPVLNLPHIGNPYELAVNSMTQKMINHQYSNNPVVSNGARKSLSEIPNILRHRYADMAAHAGSNNKQSQAHAHVIQLWQKQHQTVNGVPFQYVPTRNNPVTVRSAPANANNGGGWVSKGRSGGSGRGKG